MSKILAVFGATGRQGSSVVNHVLNDPELSTQFKIRAVTRDVNSEKSKRLLSQGNMEVVQGDTLNRASLETALTGVHTVFIMTTRPLDPSVALDPQIALDIELNTAKMIADVAVEKGAEYIIFSTLPPVRDISGGKVTAMTFFDAKAKAEQYIRGLPIKSAFVCLGAFMENLNSQPFLAPRRDPSSPDTWILARHVSSKTQIPYIDAGGDTGKFVGAILAEPDKYEGITFCAAEKLYTLEELVAILSEATGKTVLYKRISREEFKESLNMIPEYFAEIMVEALDVGEQFGYFGKGGEERVAWARENARGKLASLEDFLERHPLVLK